MPNIAIPDELQGKNWFAHALPLTTCSVHKSSQNRHEKVQQPHIPLFYFNHATYA
jgi:hypothetical protein